MIIPAQPGWFVSYRIDGKSYSRSIVAWVSKVPDPQTLEGATLIPMVVGGNCDNVVPVPESDIDEIDSILAPHEAYQYCITRGTDKTPDEDWEAIGFTDVVCVLWRRPHGG